MSVAASLNVAKEAEAQSNKSRKNKNPTRASYPNNKPSPQQQYQSSSRSKDAGAYDGIDFDYLTSQASKISSKGRSSNSYSHSKPSDPPPYPSNSSLLGVRLPPDTEIIKYTSGSKKSCKFLSQTLRIL